MGLELYIQPGDQRPGGKPAGRINVAHGAKPRHVDEAIAAGVNMISLRMFRWRDMRKQDKVWAANCDIDRVEGRLSELGWTRWSIDRNCWLPPNAPAEARVLPSPPAGCSAWIAVKDRFPDDARDVLTFGRYGVHKACFEWGTEDDPCWWSDEVRKADFKESVTHWAELPNDQAQFREERA